MLINSKLIAEMIAKGDFTAVKEAMEQSIAEGSQSFEEDLARLINQGLVSRDEALAFADSPTNLMWRLHNDPQVPTRQPQPEPEPADADAATFTEITLDVRPDDLKNRGEAPWLRR